MKETKEKWEKSVNVKFDYSCLNEVQNLDQDRSSSEFVPGIQELRSEEFLTFD